MLKQKLIKYKLIEEHLKAVRAGKYELARALLRLIRKHETRVYLDDVSCAVECIAAECGCRISYSRTYNSAYIRF